jgi:hypothetical protein
MGYHSLISPPGPGVGGCVPDKFNLVYIHMEVRLLPQLGIIGLRTNSGEIHPAAISLPSFAKLPV